ncbi:MAG: class I SAM-dependent methyltransferase [Geminicoccaceae bacterium]|nr:class I SAM-dependent methyltransferase [Geminicoccaceae bacterium]
MRPDILELDRFYDGPHGVVVRRIVVLKLRQLWPSLKEERVLGVGHAAPFLGALKEAATGIALFPATQGAARHPKDGPGLAALAREDELPFQDAAFDRVLLVHALECSPHPNRLLREAWRVLRDGGRLVVVVPNRTGLWCWSERTPFGYGQPYTAAQLQRLLRAHLFEPLEERRALWLPPWRRARRFLFAAERAGTALAPRFSGVLLREAEKRIWLAPPALAQLRPSSRRYLQLPELTAARDEG